MKSWNEIRKAATAFSKRWKDAYDEKSQAQNFLGEFFELFGVDVVVINALEHRVKFTDGSQGYADCFWQGKILIEMKSRGKDLDCAYKQAMEYVRTLPPADYPHAVVVSDFQRFRFYNLEKDNALTEFALNDLRKYVTLFGFMIGADDGGEIREQDPVNRKAAEKMARLHDAMKAVGYAGHPLEVYLVRLLFCLFSEDTDIFKPNQFCAFIEKKTSSDGSDLAAKLAELFQVLNTPPELRLSTRDESIAAFPYVNGGLFAEPLPIAAFSEEMRTAILKCAALDWSKISPAIFGAMFQGVMDEKARHDLGAHYTSEENILKLIRPLFLDSLRAEFDAIVGNVAHAKSAKFAKDFSEGTLRTSRTLREKRERLQRFHEKIASLTFLDPACGCGNFLLIAYRELRSLEMDVLEELHKDDPSLVLDVSQLCKVSVSQFYGIEIEPFPAEIAKVALWLMDHLCNMEVAKRFGQYFVRIPIKDSPHIVCANALTTDWGSLLTGTTGILPVGMTGAMLATGTTGILPVADTQKSVQPCFSYIFGNPPFLGRAQKGPERQAEIAQFFDYRDIDYVACWYAKANDYMNGLVVDVAPSGDGRAVSMKPPLPSRCAFVSTNSITQGEQVAPLWRRMNAEIDFAYRTFKWHNEAKGVAAVHCVIIGFHAKENSLTQSSQSPQGVDAETSRTSRTSRETKTIYDFNGAAIPAAHINGYLMDAPDVILAGRPRPLCASAPALAMGNMPLDGGNLIIEAGDLPQFVENGGLGATALPSVGRAGSPQPADLPPYIKRLTGSKEYIKGEDRWCLWLKDVEPSELRKMPLVMERVAKCREWRLASKSESTRRLAATPTLFREQKNPKSAIIIPKVSSEKRDYIPIGFIDDSVIVTDLAFVIPDANLYHFGILTSRMHNAWMRAVAGRLKSDYRYSKDIVYNNFVWPEELLSLRGDSESRSFGEDSNTSPNLQDSQTPSSESKTLRTLRTLREAISEAAQAVLDTRAAHPGATLADLYDPLAMPPDLVKAHAHLDALVDTAYGLGRDKARPSQPTDADRVAHLFKLYAERAARQ